MKMAAYCRVSTEKEEQLSSLENQREFFEQYADKEGDTLVKIYADMYNPRLIQCPAHGSVGNGLKQRLSTELSVLPKVFFFMLWNDCMIAKAI